MYLHIGQDVVVKFADIVGIFDFENTSVSKITKSFLNKYGKQNQVIALNDELPKSFIVTQSESETTIYISSLSTATLVKRGNNGFFSII